jgi:valyl-tRNA synthetase
MDDGLSAAVRKVFVELYRDGLIYKDQRLVNWDPKFQTAISDLEVQQVEVKGSLWHFKYPIEGLGEAFITVATTRPETMLGDTAVAVHPEDERYRDFVGKNVILPLVGRRIPIIADEYSDPEKGTGAVKITPAHDFNDFEVGRRHRLPVVNVLDRSGRMNLRENAAFLEGVPPSPELEATLALHGLDRFEARKRVVARMEELGLVDKIEPHTHMVPHGDRSGVVIEPYLTDQWYVNAKELAYLPMAAVREGHAKILPEQWEATFFQWMENIQPWCVSRQIWWGHQIPAWYGPDDKVFVAESEDEALAEALAYYVVNNVLTKQEANRIATDPEKRATFLTRDPDVLDTWFSSGLWPFSTLGWPDDTEELKRFYPTSVLVTGFDIIFFWVARMMMLGMHFMKEVPFHTVYIHGIVRDERGQKMSKSKGNVVDPLELIDEYGADALRFTMAALATQGRDIKPSRARIEGYRNFATKLWNACRFAEMNGCAAVSGFDPRGAHETLNRWIAHETAKATREITGALQAFRFNDAADTAYHFVWDVFCDWYIELAKPALTGPNGAARDETRAVTSWVRDQVLMLLHPFMPFITEELWTVTAPAGIPRESMLVLASWPELKGLDDPEAEAEIGWVIDLIAAVRSVRAEMNVAPALLVPLIMVDSELNARVRMDQWSDVVKRMARVSDVDFADVMPANAAQLVVRGETIALPLKGIIDVAAERVRLQKELAKVAADMARADAKLNNSDFIKRAPEEVVDGEREKRDEAELRRSKLEAALERLKAAA